MNKMFLNIRYIFLGLFKRVRVRACARARLPPTHRLSTIIVICFCVIFDHDTPTPTPRVHFFHIFV